MNQAGKVSYLWEYLYILGLTVIICLLSFLCFRLPYLYMLIPFIAAVACSIIVWISKLSKRLLLFNDVILTFAPLCLAYLLVTFFLKSMSLLVVVILEVAVIDVYSFTRFGKNTLNAKAISNTNTLVRLSVCLPVPKKPGLQPVMGVGDLNYYAIIAMFFLIYGGTGTGFIASLIIFAGQLLNVIAILIIRKKPWYKGFPATLFPGLLIFLAILLRVIR